MSSIGLDLHSVVLPVVRSDCLADWVEVVLLGLIVKLVSVESNMSSSVTLDNSLHW